MKASAIYRKSIGRALSGASHVITFVMRCALAKATHVTTSLLRRATSGASHVIFASARGPSREAWATRARKSDFQY